MDIFLWNRDASCWDSTAAKNFLELDAEQEFHSTAQRNALGGYIGCTGPDCEALVEHIQRENAGHKLQSFPL